MQDFIHVKLYDEEDDNDKPYEEQFSSSPVSSCVPFSLTHIHLFSFVNTNY
jgi:hypothetical protein